MQVGKLRQSPTTLVYSLRHSQRENCGSADTQGPGYAGYQVTGLIPSLVSWGEGDLVSMLAMKWGACSRHERWQTIGPQNWHLKRPGTGSIDLIEVTDQVYKQPGQKARCLQSTTAEITQHSGVQRQCQGQDVGSRDTMAHWPKVLMRIILGEGPEAKPESPNLKFHSKAHRLAGRK